MIERLCWFVCRSVIFNLPAAVLYETLMTFLGVAIFAYYTMVGCDLQEAGLIQSSNEVNREHLQSKYPSAYTYLCLTNAVS